MSKNASARKASRRRPTPFGLRISSALLALVAASGPARSQAQDTAPAQTVVISAKGYASTDVDTPMSLSILEREDLLRRGALTPGEALRGQPGLAVTVDSAQGLNPVIRGLKKESVVLLVDGMRLNSAQPQGAVASFMSLALAERLEVVKGPASVLYGTGALGGVVNVLLPQARFDPGLTLRANLGGESANEALRAAAVVNLSQGDHALMLGLAGARVQDYASPRGRVEKTGYDSGSAIAQVRLRLDARQQLRASLQRHRDEDVWYPGSIKPLANPALGTSIIHSPLQQRELGEIGYSRIGSGALPLNLDLRVYRQAMSRSIDSRALRLEREVAQTQVEFETWGVDAKADWLVHPQHLLALGLSAWRMQAAPERYLASPTPLSPLVRNDPFSDGQIDALGAFVQDDMRFGKLGVLAALRLDHVAGRAASIGNGVVTRGLARSDNAASWSLGASYEVTPLLRPYASLSRAFRAGEMRERFEASPRGDGYFYLGNPQIAPELATQLELGVKGADAALSWSAAVFHNRISDYITGQPTGTTQGGLPVKATVNLGRVEISGLEAQARWLLRAGQWLNAGLSALRGRNRDLDEPLFQMPADELSLGWDGRLAPGWSADATLRLVRRQGRVATRFSHGSENATPGFVTADLGLSWRFAGNQQLRLALRNLADKTYHEHLTEGLSGQEIPAAGRSILLGWQAKF